MDSGPVVTNIHKRTEKALVSPHSVMNGLCDLGWDLAVLSLSFLFCEMG